MMMKSKYKIGVGGFKIDAMAKKYVLDALEHNRLSYGPYTEKFEERFAQIHNRHFAIFCNSGTSALQVAFHALKKKYQWPNQAEVIVPALTFVASINTILQNNLTPVFVDIESDYFGIDTAKIEEKITDKTVAIEPAHLFGQPCEMDKIVRIARKYKLTIVEDSCETLFAKYKGRTVGSFGEVSCFSTQSAHFIVTGVGGLVTTDDHKLANSIRSLANCGRDPVYISIDDDDSKDDQKLKNIINRRFLYTDIGYSYRVTELQGALGLAQLEKWKKMIAQRKKNAAYLTKKLSPLKSYLQLPKIRPETEHTFMVYPIVVKMKKSVVMDLVFYLERNGIETRFLLPTLTQLVYKNLFGDIASDFPVAQRVSTNGFYIGCHQELNRQELNYIVEQFFEYFKKKKFL